MEGEKQEQQTALTVEATATIAGGRYYGCIFCKGGFETAQALGGHMNIHRRERCRIRPATRVDYDKEGYHPYSRHSWHALPQFKRWATNKLVYFQENLESSKKLGRPREQPEAGKREEKKRVEAGKERREEDLDLELRLGNA